MNIFHQKSLLLSLVILLWSGQPCCFAGDTDKELIQILALAASKTWCDLKPTESNSDAFHFYYEYRYSANVYGDKIKVAQKSSWIQYLLANGDGSAEFENFENTRLTLIRFAGERAIASIDARLPRFGAFVIPPTDHTKALYEMYGVVGDFDSKNSQWTGI